MTAGPDSELNVLLLHALGDLSLARRTSLNHLTCLSRYVPGHNYLFHDVHEPVTAALRKIQFHAVWLDVTFLCMRYLRPRARFEEIVDRYAFIAEGDAVRLAFPQDEYDHSELLDEWLETYRTDAVYSVVWNGWNLFFPRTSRRAEIHRALTGYVDDADVLQIRVFARAFVDRTIDVGYRARELPPQFGRHGRMKSELGHRFASSATGRGLRLDVSTRPEDALVGESWLRFLGNSRHSLGCEGGSSVWDPRGEIRDRVEAYLAEHPQARFEEVESKCFPGEEGQHVFSAASPRLFEVAAARSSQVLVRAPYLGVLRPDEHYVPLEPDVSNIDEALEKMADVPATLGRIEACYESLIAPDTYRYSRFARSVWDKIREKRAEKGASRHGVSAFASLAREHRATVRRSRRRTKLLEAGLQAAWPLRRLIPPPFRAALRRHLRGR